MVYNINGFKLSVGIKADSEVNRCFVSKLGKREKGEVVVYSSTSPYDFERVKNIPSSPLPKGGLCCSTEQLDEGYILKLSSLKIMRIEKYSELAFFFKTCMKIVNNEAMIDYESVAKKFNAIIVSDKVRKELMWDSNCLILVSVFKNIIKYVGDR